LKNRDKGIGGENVTKCFFQFLSMHESHVWSV